MINLTAIWLYRDRNPDDTQSSGFAPSLTTLPTRDCPLCGSATAGTVPAVADGLLRWLCLTHAARIPVPTLARGRDVVQYHREAMAR